MSRDNISEMARVMCGRDKDCLLCPVQTPCLLRNCAELLNAEGYQKASDVALEVIEKAIELTRSSADEAKLLADAENDALQKAELRGEQIGALLALSALKKLKKKYAEEGK